MNSKQFADLMEANFGKYSNAMKENIIERLKHCKPDILVKLKNAVIDNHNVSRPPNMGDINTIAKKEDIDIYSRNSGGVST